LVSLSMGERRTMSFEWDRMYKWEENFEREIRDEVEKYVFEFYNVDSISELTKEQIDELTTFADTNHYSVMKSGFYSIVNDWESEVYVENEEEADWGTI